MFDVKQSFATVRSKGEIVIPASVRRRLGITTGTKVKVLEDQFGRIVLQPITEDYVDRVMGCLADGPDLVRIWLRSHRKEGRRGK
jgi:AbrB family looped-hinge helix DNA binding protein